MANILAVAGPNSRYKLPGARPAGFWVGVWHGLIAPLTFLVSLLDPGVRIYETTNRGRLYDFGFIIGLSGSFLGFDVGTLSLEMGDVRLEFHI